MDEWNREIAFCKYSNASFGRVEWNSHPSPNRIPTKSILFSMKLHHNNSGIVYSLSGRWGAPGKYSFPSHFNLPSWFPSIFSFTVHRPLVSLHEISKIRMKAAENLYTTPFWCELIGRRLTDVFDNLSKQTCNSYNNKSMCCCLLWIYGAVEFAVGKCRIF